MNLHLSRYRKVIVSVIVCLVALGSIRTIMRTSSSKSNTGTSLSQKELRSKAISQSGILPEGDSIAYYGTFNVHSDVFTDREMQSEFIKAIKLVDSILEDVSIQSQTRVTGTISFGSKLWKALVEGNQQLATAGADLFDFPGYGKAPATQCDLYLHIHSTNQGATYDASQRIYSVFPEGSLILGEERNGFMWRDSRDLTGFIDGTENPQGVEKRMRAALREDGSSFVVVQRFVHHLEKWEQLKEGEQEEVIGRKKIDSMAIEPAPAMSHVAHTDISFEGESIKIVRHSLPYGSPGAEKGLWFTAYCKSMKHHNELQRSIYGLRDGKADSLMSYITPVSGGFYFTPSLKQINLL